MVHITKTAEETERLGHTLAVGDSRILCLYGELGSGKTTLAKGYAKGLGYTGRLLSPTFIIVRRYQLPKKKWLYHVDLYRISNEKDIEELGLSEVFADPASYVVVEWAERLGELVPRQRTEVFFKTLSDGQHRIDIT